MKKRKKLNIEKLKESIKQYKQLTDTNEQQLRSLVFGEKPRNT